MIVSLAGFPEVRVEVTVVVVVVVVVYCEVRTVKKLLKAFFAIFCTCGSRIR